MNIAHFKFFITFSSVLEQADLSEIEGVISGNSTWPYLMLLFFLASALVSMLANAFFYRHLNMLARSNIDQNKLIAIIAEQISAGLVLSNQSQSLFCSFCCLALSLKIIKSLFTRIYSSEDLSS